MLRALSTRNGGRGYEKLLKEEYDHNGDLLDAKLTRARTVPAAPAAAKLFSPSTKDSPATREAKTEEKKAKKVSKIHPIFNLFHPRLRKKATAKPEFSRYLEYLREGGILPTNGNVPPAI